MNEITPNLKNRFIRTRRFIVGVIFLGSLLQGTMAAVSIHQQPSASSASSTDTKQRAIADFVSRPALSHASVGISLVRLSDGKELATHQAQLALTPASTLKTLTTATALRLCGPDARFVTCVGYRGMLQDSVLRGDLIIRGGGDPSLASRFDTRGGNHFFSCVADALRRAGIRRLEGRIVADDSALPTEGVMSGWTWEDLGNYFAAGLYGLNYADNTYALVFDTSIKGAQPQVLRTSPTMPELRFHNCLLAKNARSDSAYLYGAPYSNDRYIYGALPHTKPTYTIKGDMPDPAWQLAAQLSRFLISQGFTVDATMTTGRRLLESGCDAVTSGAGSGDTIPVIAKELLRYESMNFRSLVRQTNLHSINLFAEGMLRALAPDASTAIARELAYWKGEGLDTRGLRVDDGSGLAPTNKLTPAFLTGVMQKMQADKAFRASLPAVGREGTVGALLQQSPLAGKLRLKSGTIRGVMCYVGYVETDEPCAICIMVNNYTGSTSEMRRAIEKLLSDMLL